ncbi:MAG: hypothetical protein KDI68_04915 [Gammaproteobacteria bacterium]|nr:hypothetical protein [Gammaproteobacteria bacterium]
MTKRDIDFFGLEKRLKPFDAEVDDRDQIPLPPVDGLKSPGSGSRRMTRERSGNWRRRAEREVQALCA